MKVITRRLKLARVAVGVALGMMTVGFALVGSATEAADWFAYRGDVSGSNAVVGQRFSSNGIGDATVYTWGGGDPNDWYEQIPLASLLFPGEVANGAEFGGGALAIDGNTILVGAHRDTVQSQNEAGSAFVFTRNGATWARQAQLRAPGLAVENALFGAAGDVSGDRALLTAPGTNQAYMFTRTGTTWNAGVALSGATLNVPFDAALDGNVAVVGSIGDSAHADVWRFNAGTSQWNFEATIANPGDADNWFGSSVALSGDTLVVGARDQAIEIPFFPEPITVPSVGAAYVYRYSGSTWNLEQTIRNPAMIPSAGDRFGYDVAVAGDRLLIGAPQMDDDGEDAGLAYLYERIGDTWSLAQTLHDDDPAAEKWFGQIVALDETGRLVGGTSRDGHELGAGVGDVDITSTGSEPVWGPGDANKDGLVNQADAAILAANWLRASGVGWDQGDFNDDGKVNDLDASILAAHWLYAGPTGAAVPEPSTLAGLLAVLLTGAALARRRRA